MRIERYIIVKDNKFVVRNRKTGRIWIYIHI